MSVTLMASRICVAVDRLFGDWRPENLEAGTFVRKRQFTIATLLKLWSFSAFDGGRQGDEAVIGELWRRGLFPLGQWQATGDRRVRRGVPVGACGHGGEGDSRGLPVRAGPGEDARFMAGLPRDGERRHQDHHPPH